MKRVQIAIVGGGPAGLSAAITAARAGAQVSLFDENAALGGQLRYRLLDGEQPLAPVRDRLIAEATAVGVDLNPSANVWGAFVDRVLGVTAGGASYHLQAERVILATGSTDLPYPFSGGSLPGVLTARAVQLLLHVHRVLPGERCAVIGSGPEALEVARDVTLAGGHVVIMVDPRHSDVVQASGSTGVQSLTVGGRHYDVDLIVVAVGRQPDAQLAMMMECDRGYSADAGGIVPIRDERCGTSIAGVLVAGDSAGVRDLTGAMRDGTHAGASAAHDLGLLSDDDFAMIPRSGSFGAINPVPIYV